MNNKKPHKAHKWEVTAWEYPYVAQGTVHTIGTYSSQREAYNAIATIDDITHLSIDELDTQVRFAPGEQAIYRIERIY